MSIAATIWIKAPRSNPGLPAVFQQRPPNRPFDRLKLARWLVDKNNPLTARVIANRYWEALFGRGIVATSEDFGSQGDPPTHPELLDWLADGIHGQRLGHQGADSHDWSLRPRIGNRANSSTMLRNVDPDNRWLARGPRVRLSAEMVRDQALARQRIVEQANVRPAGQPAATELRALTAAFGGSTDWKTSPAKIAIAARSTPLGGAATRILRWLRSTHRIAKFARCDRTSHEHAAAIAGDAERPGVRRGRARPWPAGRSSTTARSKIRSRTRFAAAYCVRPHATELQCARAIVPGLAHSPRRSAEGSQRSWPRFHSASCRPASTPLTPPQ